jgi:transcription elongation factor Elf1
VTSEQTCIEALQEAARLLGESPSKAEYERLGLTPASGTIIRQCGGWNAAKELAGLETEPSTGSRTAEKPDDVELPDGVEWSELSQDQRWDYRHPQRNVQSTLDRRQRLRAWLFERKRELGCAECGADDASSLDFHHPEDADKKMDVSTMVTYGYGRERLQREIDRCEVLCANCHRREHNEPPSPVSDMDLSSPPERPPEEVADRGALAAVRRAWTHEYKRYYGCQRCGERDPLCLVFHHCDPSEKSGSVSQLIVGNSQWEQIREEIAKCEVLCANCHREEHYNIPDGTQEQDSS